MKRTILGAAALTLALASAAAAQTPCRGSYTAQEGDVLAEIANRCGVTLPALLAANPGVRDNMDFDAGAVFRIPDPGDPQPSPQAACGVSYTIRSGDTLAEIAEKCGLTVPLLAAANGPLPSPVGLRAGERLHIPDVPATAVADPATLAVATAAAEAAVEVVVETEAEAEETIEAGAAEAEAEAEVQAEEATEEAAGEAAEAAAETRGEEAEAAAEAATLVRVEGILGDGEPCPVVRQDDGTEHALVGAVGDDFQAGDRVVVLGVATEAGACEAGAALDIRIIYRPR